MFKRYTVKRHPGNPSHRQRRSHVGRPPLHEAVLTGNQVVIKVDLNNDSEGLDINSRDADNNTALHLAIQQGYHKWVDYLLDNKADTNAANKWGLTPLMLAAKHKQPEIMLCLLNHGADVHYVNDKGQTSLHYVASGGCETCMRYILQFKPKLNLQDNDKCTPLSIACKLRQGKMASMLLKHKAVAKANPNLKDTMGRTPLHWAAELGDVECAEALIEAKADLDIRDELYETPFVRSIKQDKQEVVSLLIRSGCDRSDIDGLNGTAMTLACMLGRSEIVQMLLEAGEDIDELGHVGLTPLMCALFECHVDVVDMLLDHGADPNLEGRMGVVPLVFVTLYLNEQNVEKRHQIAKLLVRANANPNHRVVSAGFFTAKTNGRNCALSYAISSAYVSLVQMFLLAGSDITFRDLLDWMRNNDVDLTSYNRCDLMRPIAEWTKEAHSLKHLCRKQIREILGHGVQHKIHELPVPSVIKKYIDFEELDHVSVEKARTSLSLSESAVALPPEMMPPCRFKSLEGTLCYDFMHKALGSG